VVVDGGLIDLQELPLGLEKTAPHRGIANHERL